MCAQGADRWCVVCCLVCRIQVFVKGLDMTITLDLFEDECNLFDLRSNIFGKTKISTHDQCLKFAGKMLPHQDILQDEVKFEDIGIEANSTIHLSFYMLGGMDAGTG